MPLAITLGSARNPTPYPIAAAVETHHRQATRCRSMHNDKRDPKVWRASSSRGRSTIPCTIYLLRYYVVAEHGLDPTRTSISRAVVRRRDGANLRPDISDGFLLGPDRENQSRAGL